MERKIEEKQLIAKAEDTDALHVSYTSEGIEHAASLFSGVTPYSFDTTY